MRKKILMSAFLQALKKKEVRHLCVHSCYTCRFPNEQNSKSLVGCQMFPFGLLWKFKTIYLEHLRCPIRNVTTLNSDAVLMEYTILWTIKALHESSTGSNWIIIVFTAHNFWLNHSEIFMRINNDNNDITSFHTVLFIYFIEYKVSVYLSTCTKGAKTTIFLNLRRNFLSWTKILSWRETEVFRDCRSMWYRF